MLYDMQKYIIEASVNNVGKQVHKALHSAVRFVKHIFLGKHLAVPSSHNAICDDFINRLYFHWHGQAIQLFNNCRQLDKLFRKLRNQIKKGTFHNSNQIFTKSCSKTKHAYIINVQNTVSKHICCETKLKDQIHCLITSIQWDPFSFWTESYGILDTYHAILYC